MSMIVQFLVKEWVLYLFITDLGTIQLIPTVTFSVWISLCHCEHYIFHSSIYFVYQIVMKQNFYNVDFAVRIHCKLHIRLISTGMM